MCISHIWMLGPHVLGFQFLRWLSGLLHHTAAFYVIPASARILYIHKVRITSGHSTLKSAEEQPQRPESPNMTAAKLAWILFLSFCMARCERKLTQGTNSEVSFRRSKLELAQSPRHHR